jgi:predicted ATP-grasp superfamily ATP-dependent carboligase
MVSISSPLKNKSVGVIGFNARPIACSAKKAGAKVFVSDYWGDEDLSSCCNDWVAILTPTPGERQRQPIDIPLYEGLVENLLYITKEHELDYVLIGSGFDDHVDALIPLHREGILVGCSPNQMRSARDYTSLAKLVTSLGIHTPQRILAETPNEAIEISRELTFPFLVRPTHSGGGRGIRLIRTPHDIVRAFKEPEDDQYEPRILQDYIRGIDISCSILVAENQAITLSVQGQLIGMPTAGRNCDFAYCGNYYPSGLSKDMTLKIAEVSELIGIELKLSGSVGLDFVIDESKNIWLMEVNPRFQGTLELIEAAGEISVTSLHVHASHGVLPVEIPVIRPGVKMIVYSRCDGRVPDLAQYSNTVDRTPPGVNVNMRDPICSVIEVGTSMKDCYWKASATALAIQKRVS